MLNNIKGSLRKNKCVYFWGNVIRYLGEEDFRDYVRNYGGEDVLFVKHLGELYPEKLIYNIVPNQNTGFFNEITNILMYLSYADFYHLTPVVNWTGNKCYSEKELINGTKNIFEYYFLPVSEVSDSDIHKCKNVVDSCFKQIYVLENREVNDYYQRRNRIGELSTLYQKYFRLNPTVRNYIDTNLAKKLGKRKTLGVHVRGTDFKQEFAEHPKCIRSEDWKKQAMVLMEKYGYEQVFLATDSLEAVDLFKREFGTSLLYYEDVQRSDGEVGVHYLKNSRKNHHYLLGLEVLRDAYTLAACDSLLAGLSNVSTAAQYIKMAAGCTHEEAVILDYGINHNNRRFNADIVK